MGPTKSSGFGFQAYWDELYGKGGANAPLDEWLRPLADYLPHLAGALAPGVRTLIVGCGNSAAAFDLVERGFSPDSILSVDYSPPVIERMRREAAARGLPDLRFEVLDCTDMRSLESGTFDVVIDKSTLDALACAPDHAMMVERYVAEVRRVLRPGGRWILISLSPLLRDHFAPDGGWDVTRTDVLENPELIAAGHDVPEMFNFLYVGKKTETKSMRITLLGTWPLGHTLGARLTQAGHEVRFGALPGAPQTVGGLVSPREAVEGSEVIILATPWAWAEAHVRAAGDLGGRPLLDATNPLGTNLELVVGHSTSGAELIQFWAPTARVVKAFHVAGPEGLPSPHYATARAVLFLAGDDPDARAVAAHLARSLGFDALEVGPLEKARLLEPLARLWLELAARQGGGVDLNFQLLRRAIAGGV